MNAQTLMAAALAAAMMTITVSLFGADQPADGIAGRSETTHGYSMTSGQDRNE